MAKATNPKLAGSLAVSLSLVLGACGGMASDNRTLYSVRQPVVERTNFTLDATTAGDGLPVSEQQRIADWFDAMDLGYGDRVSLDDPSSNPGVKRDLAALAGRHGVLISEEAPVTGTYVSSGQARIVLTRSTASVPGCPDWSANGEHNHMNATSPGYGCGVNGNLAAMVADPDDLIEGKADNASDARTINRAIGSYREGRASGEAGLTQTDTQSGGGGQ